MTGVNYKKVKNMRSVSAVILSLLCAMIVGCDKTQIDVLSENTIIPQKCVMNFSAPKPHFDDVIECRAGESEWNDKDSLYIYFQNTSCVARAVYRSSSGLWDVEKKGDLKEAGECVIYHISSDCSSSFWDMSDVYKLTLNIHSPLVAIYRGVGVYKYENGELFIGASLHPMTSRVRFVSKEASEIKVKGINRIETIYNPHNHSNEHACMPLNISINKLDENGMYTSDYIYGVTSEDYKMMQIFDSTSPDIFYERNFQDNNNFMEIGKSGRIEIPSNSNYNGWGIKNNFVKNIVDYVDVTIHYTQYKYNVGKAAGYGVRCEADLKNPTDIEIRYVYDGDTFDGANWLFNSDIGKDFSGILSMDIPCDPTYEGHDVSIIFDNNYGGDSDKAVFSNVKLYHFSY